MYTGRHIIRIPMNTTLAQEQTLRRYSGTSRAIWNKLLGYRDSMKKQGFFVSYSGVTVVEKDENGEIIKDEKGKYKFKKISNIGLQNFINIMKYEYPKMSYLKDEKFPLNILRGAACKLEDAYKRANAPDIKAERAKALAQAKTPKEKFRAANLGYPRPREKHTFPAICGFFCSDGITYEDNKLKVLGFRDGLRLVSRTKTVSFTSTQTQITNKKTKAVKTADRLIANDGRYQGIVSSVEFIYDKHKTYNEPYIDKETNTRKIRQRGGWFACLNLEVDFVTTKNDKAIGIDVGCRTTAMTSEGKEYNLPESIKKLEQKRQVYQRDLSHKENVQRLAQNKDKPEGEDKNKYVFKMTGKYEKLKKKIARLDRKIANTRKSFLHSVSKEIANNYGTVAIEKLKIKNMSASAAGTVEEPGTNVAAKSGLNRSILRGGWGILGEQLEYKLARKGGELLRVNPAHTSQDCPECKHRDAANRPDKGKKFKCVKCGYENDADIVGAINILARSKDKANLVTKDKPGKADDDPIDEIVSVEVSAEISAPVVVA